MSAPRVKPLVWKAYGETHWIAPAPLFGSFRVEHYGDERWQALWSVPGYCAAFVDGEFATADEAKAAIEARILAALEPAPDAPSDGGPAYPVMWDHAEGETGMSLRDWFAGQALAGIIAHPNNNDTEGGALFARSAYKIADSMIAARGSK